MDQPVRHSTAEPAAPQFTYTDNNGFTREDITPYDFATIYNVLPIWTPASKATIRPSPSPALTTSRSRTSPPFKPPSACPIILPPPSITATDPGEGDGSGRGENTLDVEWSGAVAPSAKIVLVVSANTATTFGGQLSDSYIVDNKTATIMSASYGACELNLGTSGNAAYNSIWQQGAAEGISIFESSGDQGSAGCTSQDNPAPNPDTKGLQVNGMASSPYLTRRRRHRFHLADRRHLHLLEYFEHRERRHRQGYIPEIPWNSTCTSTYIVSLSGDASGEAFCNDAYDGQFQNYEDFVSIAAGTAASATAPRLPEPPPRPAREVTLNQRGKPAPEFPPTASATFPTFPSSPPAATRRHRRQRVSCLRTTSTSTCDYTDPSEIIYQEIGGTSALLTRNGGHHGPRATKNRRSQGLINLSSTFRRRRKPHRLQLHNGGQRQFLHFLRHHHRHRSPGLRHRRSQLRHQQRAATYLAFSAATAPRKATTSPPASAPSTSPIW